MNIERANTKSRKYWHESRVALAFATLALGICLWLLLDSVMLNLLNRPTRVQMLVVEDELGNDRMMLTTRPDGAPSFSLLDSSGNVRIELGITQTDIPGISLLSSDGKTRLSLSLRATGNQPEMTMYSKEGARKWRVWLDETGKPQILNE